MTLHAPARSWARRSWTSERSADRRAKKPKGGVVRKCESAAVAISNHGEASPRIRNRGVDPEDSQGQPDDAEQRAEQRAAESFHAAEP